MPTDITDASIATACVYCMMLARSGALDAFDGLSALSRATALSCATVIFSTLACTLAFAISLLLPSLDATLQPFAAMALAALLLTASSAIARNIHKPLHTLLHQLQPWLLPTCTLVSAASLMISPAQNLLHAALGAIIQSLLLSLLLQFCLYISVAMAAIPRINLLPQNSAQFHALTLATAGLLAYAGSVAAGYW